MQEEEAIGSETWNQLQGYVSVKARQLASREKNKKRVLQNRVTKVAEEQITKDYEESGNIAAMLNFSAFSHTNGLKTVCLRGTLQIFPKKTNHKLHSLLAT